MENRVLPRASKPDPYDKIRILSKTIRKIEDPAKMAYSIPDRYVGAATLMCERKKEKLR